MREIPFWHIHVYKVTELTEVDWTGKNREDALDGAIKAVKQGVNVNKTRPPDCEYIALAFKQHKKMRDTDIKFKKR